MDEAEHAIAEGYVTPDGAITDEGFEAFALGQGPFALKIRGPEGELLHIRTQCDRCRALVEPNEASSQERWRESPGIMVTVCPECALKPPPQLTRSERREHFGACWDPWCGGCAHFLQNRFLWGAVRRWLWKRKHPKTWESRYGDREEERFMQTI